MCDMFIVYTVHANITVSGLVRMANPGSSRVSRDPFELLGALSK